MLLAATTVFTSGGFTSVASEPETAVKDNVVSENAFTDTGSTDASENIANNENIEPSKTYETPDGGVEPYVSDDPEEVLQEELSVYAEGELSGSCGLDLSYQLTNPNVKNGVTYYTLEISGSGDMADYENASRFPWYSNRGFIEEVKFVYDCKITSISASAFSEASALTRVINMPPTVNKIGAGAFKNCRNLVYIDLAAATTMGVGVFGGCTKLTSAGPIGHGSYEIQYRWEDKIPDFAFHGSNLTSVEFPEGLTEIGKSAFYGNSALSSVRFPSTLKKIGNQAFYNCSSISEISLPDGIESINHNAFMGVTSLSHLVIPESFIPKSETNSGLTAIFSGCTNLTTAGPIGDGNNYDIEFGWKKEIPSHTFIGMSQVTAITIPEGIEIIRQYAFNDTRIKSFTIPDSVKYIYNDAFSGCNELKSIDMPDGVFYLGPRVFKNCTKLESINIPKNISTIDSEAFYNCSSLTRIEIPDNVQKLDGKALEGCSSLQEVRGGLNIVSSSKLPNNVGLIFYGYENTSLAKWAKNKTVGVSDNITFKNLGTCTHVYYKENLPNGDTNYATSFDETYHVKGQPYGKLYDIKMGDGISGTSYSKYSNRTLMSLNVESDFEGKYTNFRKHPYFIGWYTDKVGGTKITPETIVSMDAEDEIYLYAHYSNTTNPPSPTVSYKIAFNGNGATSGTMSTMTCKDTQSYTLPANAFKRTGFTFAGWNTKDGTAYSDKQVISGLATEGTVTLYAQWTPIEYTITYELNGGNQNSNNKTSYTSETETFTINDPTRIGNTFAGWYLDSKLTKKADPTIRKGSTGNKSFYAKWTINKLTIEFKANTPEGETLSGSKANIVIDHGAAKSLGATEGFYVSNYRFKYWTLTEEDPTPDSIEADNSKGCYANGDEYENKETDDGNKTTFLYAQWKEIEKPRYIIFRANTGASNTATVTYRFFADEANNPENKIPANTFTKKGYDFAGWSTTPDGPATVFDEVSLADAIAPFSSVTTMNLYAKWTPTVYGIKYYSNGTRYLFGSEEVMDSSDKDYDIKDPHKATDTFTIETGFSADNLRDRVPVLEGYIFAGWYSDAKIKTKVTSIGAGSTGNKSLYAKWTPIKYPIKFDGNGIGVTGNTKTITATYDKPVTLTSNGFKRTGYEFKGWATSEYGAKEYDNKKKVKNLANTESGITLYAVWEPINYKISYKNVDENTNITGSLLQIESTYTIESTSDMNVCPDNLERPGYEFVGWYKDSALRKPVTEADRTIKAGSIGNKTFYAKWTGKKYTVKFDPDGGEAKTGLKDINATYGKAFTLPANPYKLTDKKFDHWDVYVEGVIIGEFGNKQKIPANYIYKSGATAIDVGDETVTLKAAWIDYPYSITYKNITSADLEANVELKNMSTYVKKGDDQPIPVPTRVGFDFEGWYTTSTFKPESKITEIPANKTGAVTYYAKWNAHSYTIKFHSNRGIAASGRDLKDITKTYGKKVTLPNNPYTNPGYKFVGWVRVDSDGHEIGTRYTNKATIVDFYDEVAGNTSEVTDVVTLKAVWEIIPYKVTYKNIATTDTNPASNKASYDIENQINLANPIREGATFVGWYADSKYRNLIFDVAGIGNKTVYAWWTQHKFNITFDKGAEGVTGTMKDLINKSTGSAVTLPANAYKRTGYNFVGWKIAAAPDSGLYTQEMLDKIFKNKEKVTNITLGNKDETTIVTLVAQWEPIKYTVTYKGFLKGESGVKPDMTTTYTIESGDVIHPVPSNAPEGYSFGGIYMDSKFKIPSDRIPAESTGNKTYYVYWVKNSQ